MQKTILDVLNETLKLEKSELLKNDVLYTVERETYWLDKSVCGNEKVLDFLLSAFDAEQCDVEYAECAIREFDYDIEDYLSVSQLANALREKYTFVRTGKLIDWYLDRNNVNSEIRCSFSTLVDEDSLASYLDFSDWCSIGGETFWYS